MSTTVKKNASAELRHEVDTLLEGKIENQKDLAAFLVKHELVLEKIANMKSALRDWQRRAEEMLEKTVRYAKRKGNEVVFKEGIFHTVFDLGEDGVFTLTRSKDRFKRASGSTMTQEFLSGLPKAWTKTKLELSTSQIVAKRVNEEELEKNDLIREDKFVWSRGDGETAEED